MALTTVRPQGMGFVTGRRNLIINGAMQVAQRATSATGKTSSGYFLCDRWQTLISAAGTWSLSQSTTVPSGQGFAYSFKYDCTTADASLASSDYIIHRQNLEGQDLQLLSYGASDAKTVTLSFWVRSNKTGTYVCELRKYDDTRHNGGTYTINSADTWEHKTVSFSGDTASTLVNSNAGGIKVHFWLAAGSSYTSGTLPSSWASNTTANQAAGHTVNLADSTDNEWLITGVQLEVGTNASDFEHRSYGEELALCSRYYKQYKATTLYNQFAFAHSESTTIHNALFTFDPPMRDTPSAVTVGGNIGIITQWGLGVTGISSVALDANSKGFTQTRLRCTTGSGVGTAGETNILLSNNNASSTINFDAEL